MWSRRRFLSTWAALSGSSLTLERALPLFGQASRKESILVIGAGIAGLACAKALSAAGLQVTLLEARDRIGGRIHTHRDFQVPIDLGAAWIHGHLKNPITQLATEAKAKIVASDEDQGYLVSGNGREVSEKLEQQVEAEFKRLKNQLRQAQKTAKVNDSLATVLPKLISASPAELREGVRWTLFSEIELAYGNDAQALSLLGWDQDESFEGDEMVFPEGYDQITKYLSKCLKVILNQIVTTIITTGKGVTVETKEQTYQADRCVVTLPLGELKAEQVKFLPELSKAKQQAMQGLGTGRFCKIAVTFEKPFWPRELHIMASYAEPHCEIWSLLPTHNHPTLVLLSCGRTAKTWEEMKPNAVEAEAIRQIQRLFATVPKPKGVLVTSWCTDPFTLGAYSAVALGGSPKDFDTLAEPVGDRLFFAGEATSRNYAGTVHGAYLSGLREANRIQKLIG